MSEEGWGTAAPSTPRLDCTERQLLLPPPHLHLGHTSEDKTSSFESHCVGNKAESLTDSTKYKVVYFALPWSYPIKRNKLNLSYPGQVFILKTEFFKNSDFLKIADVYYMTLKSSLQIALQIWKKVQPQHRQANRCFHPTTIRKKDRYTFCKQLCWQKALLNHVLITLLLLEVTLLKDTSKYVELPETVSVVGCSTLFYS